MPRIATLPNPTTLTPAQQQTITAAAEAFVKKLLAGDATGHDWHHIQRVRRLSQRIAKPEGANPFLVDLMALLHESSDRKLIGKKTEQQALLEVRKLLSKEGLDDATIEEILYVIANQSYSKSGVKKETLDSLSGQCIQDADRLEALGAIGIARCFAYNGKRGHPMYDPAIPINPNPTQAEYLKNNGETSINHFYEKLLKLKDLMNTKTGRALAAKRHQFMEEYLEEFFAEWDGKR